MHLCPTRLQVIPRDSPLRTVIDRVREEAEHMPPEQLSKQLETQLGSQWRELLSDFDELPLAAASIGQVCALPWSLRYRITAGREAAGWWRQVPRAVGRGQRAR